MKTLVLGCEVPIASRSFVWAQVPPSLSVADFDVVVMYFDGTAIDVRSKYSPDDLPSPSQLARLLFSPASEIIVIGSPMAVLTGSIRSMTLATWWLPLSLDVHEETGTGIELADRDFAFYFNHVSEWKFHVTEHWKINQSADSVLKTLHPKAGGLQGNIVPIATTRFGGAVAFKLTLSATVPEGAETKRLDSGPIYWLPETTDLSPAESVELVLRERYQINVTTSAPGWSAQYLLPHQEEAAAQVQMQEQRLRTAEEDLMDARLAYQNEARLQALLFERGEALETLVRDALTSLGASVEERPRDREDGRLIDPAGRNGIIEVKGRNGPARLQDVRQLHQWVSDAIAEEDWSGKGILIVNAFADDDPVQRPEPFPENTARAAVRFELALLTTDQIFQALSSHQRGELNVNEFWEAVFGTQGVIQLPGSVPVPTQ